MLGAINKAERRLIRLVLRDDLTRMCTLFFLSFFKPNPCAALSSLFTLPASLIEFASFPLLILVHYISYVTISCDKMHLNIYKNLMNFSRKSLKSCRGFVSPDSSGFQYFCICFLYFNSVLNFLFSGRDLLKP